MSQHFADRLEAVFTRDEAAEIIRLGEAIGFARGALVGGLRHDNSRRSGIAWLDERATPGWLSARLAAAVAASNRAHFRFELTHFSEQLQIARYDAGEQGHFDWHSDIGDGALARSRKLTVVAQLSPPDSYAGGALELDEDGHAVAVAHGIGDVALFASFVLHRVTPVTSGMRHSLTCWVHGPAFR